MKKILPYGCQSIAQEDIEAVCLSMKGEMITRGPRVKAFEDSIASYCGVNYAVAFSSGGTALTASYMASHWHDYDQLITSSISFFATIAPAARSVLPIEFVDVDPLTGVIDYHSLETSLKKRSSRGKQVIVIPHIGGSIVDMAKVEDLVEDPNAVIIEDAAHALGGSYECGARVGSCAYSDMTILSFHPVKTITSAEGGMVTTNDRNLYERLLKLRNNGIVRKESVAPWFYDVEEFSQNFHMNDLQASLGLSQLGRIDSFIQKRRDLVQHYHKCLSVWASDLITTVPRELNPRSAYHLMIVGFDFNRLKINKISLFKALKNQGISTQVHYIPLFYHSAIKNRWPHQNYDHLKGTTQYYESALSLPLFVDMTHFDVEFVCRELKGLVISK